MYCAILRFFIGLQAGQNFAGTHFEFRQTTQAEHRIGNAACGHAIGAANGQCDIGGGDNSPGDGFPVKQAAVAGFRLQCVAYGVAKVENAAQAAFLFIGGNNFGFQLHTLGNQTFDFHGIALQNLGALLFEAQEEIEIADNAAFQGLVKPCAEGSFGQRVQNFRVNQNNAGVMIGSQQILPSPEVDSGFAANGCIHLSEDGGWDLHQIDASHVERGEQTGDVADDAAAERNENSFSVGPEAY